MRFLVLAFLAFPAAAQENCGPVEQMLTRLATQYGESLRFTGLDDAGFVNMLLTNQQTESWTALQVDPYGKACMVAAGGNAQMFPEGDPA